MGRWIIDCGHDDFSAELHPLSFLGFAHVEGKKTTARFYYNPYRDTEQYALDGRQLGAVNDEARFGSSLTFPRRLVGEVIGLDAGSVDRLRALEMVEATRVVPADFQICAPEGASGSIVVGSDVVTRPGVTVTVSSEDYRGCVTVHVAFVAYTPADAAVRVCSMPWSYLDEIVKVQVDGPIDLLGLIQSNLDTAKGKARAALDPECACADELAGPPVGDAPVGRHTRVDGAQPFPFYGVVTVERRGGG
jgi:hypothetical protein